MSSQGIQAEVETKQIYSFSQLCPAKDEYCKLYPPNQKGRRRGDWKRLAKPFGSKDQRIQRTWFALQYARAQNWLGVAMIFCAVDILGTPMHVSHFCQTSSYAGVLNMLDWRHSRIILVDVAPEWEMCWEWSASMYYQWCKYADK